MCDAVGEGNLTGQITLSSTTPTDIRLQSQLDRLASSILANRLCAEKSDPGVLGGRGDAGTLVSYNLVDKTEDESDPDAGHFEIAIQFNPYTKLDFVKRILEEALGELTFGNEPVPALAELPGPGDAPLRNRY